MIEKYNLYTDVITGVFFDKLFSYSSDELVDCYIICERYLNSGSPSGFKVDLPGNYNPFSFSRYCEVFIESSYFENNILVGETPSLYEGLVEEYCNPIIYYPLAYKKELIKGLIKLKAEPTSSGRTLLIRKKELHFIKLHFPQKIGRFDRGIQLYKWISILEKSREIKSNVEIPDFLCFLLDTSGTYNIKNGIGTIFREFDTFPKTEGKTLLIPSFSLFNNKHKALLKPLLSFLNYDEKDFLEKIIFKILRSYFFLSFEYGLMPELNAQNLLFELNLESKNIRVVMRDLGDIFIDFKIREDKGLHNMFNSYKTINHRKDNDLYKRRSFSYDFKLTKYVIEPLIDEFSNNKEHKESLNSKIKYEVNKIINSHPFYFEDKNTWYSYPKKEGVNRTSYKANSKPLYR